MQERSLSDSTEFWFLEMLRWYPCLGDEDREYKKKILLELSARIKRQETQINNFNLFHSTLKDMEEESKNDIIAKSLFGSIRHAVHLLLNA